jgi:glucokinase
MNKKIAIGVDIGGSHISCSAYDLQNKELLENTQAERDVDCHAQSEVIIEAWGKTIRSSMELAGVENVVGIGFAMPGPFDYVRGISLFTGQNGKFENTYGLNVPVELRNYLNLSDDFKIRFINDATAFAIGEDQVGMARDFSRSLSVTLGTGFGSAFIKNGLPVVEGDEVPNQGCVWHLPFEDGIADDYFSTRGLVNRFLKSTGIKVSGVKEIAQMAQDNAAARDLFNDFGAKMGVLLKPWIKSFEMEEFVMGGNISKAYPLFRESLNDFLAKENLDLNISISELKESASFIGSATLVDDEFYERVLPMLKLM